MKVLVSGASGLIGRELAPALSALGHHIIRLVRSNSASPSELPFNAACVEPSRDFVRRMDDASPDVVIHLAGENIARRRWSEDQKKRIHNSRINSTLMLTKAFERMKQPPTRFIVASAIGIYGDRGDELLTEASPTGFDFLATVCKEWEATSHKAEALNVQVTNLRFGIILSRRGGALAMMLPGFQMFMGARLGTGQQWMSWISLTDVIHAIRWLLESNSVHGPINLVAPNPVRNEEFTRTLARQLKRPAFVRAPALVLKAALGEMSTMLLSSQRVSCARLQAAGFQFKHPDLSMALEAELGLLAREPSVSGLAQAI
ncbi:MAG TPA: TIGR01777 family oxidoreductase [Methylomirabilota bacterium]|nr:TIGR01777 family oxidoreductase [Methylomirabilota bacterium]